MMKMELAEERRTVEELDALMASQQRGLRETAQTLERLRAGLKAGRPAPPDAAQQVSALEAKQRAFEAHLRESEPKLREQRLARVRRHNEILAEARAISNGVRPEWRVDGEPLK